MYDQLYNAIPFKFNCEQDHMKNIENIIITLKNYKSKKFNKFKKYRKMQIYLRIL